MIMEQKEILDRMRTLCAKREYCETDIRKKLAKLYRDLNGPFSEMSPSDARAADETVVSLRQDGYIDDYRYARAYARDKSSLSGWGKVKIRHSLAAKGIPKECIDAALSEIAEGAGTERLARALEMKAASLREDPHCKFKLLRFALGRGYEYAEIRDLVDRIMEKQQES